MYKKGFNRYRRISLDKNNLIPIAVKVETIDNLPVDDNKNNRTNDNISVNGININNINNIDKQNTNSHYSNPHNINSELNIDIVNLKTNKPCYNVLLQMLG